MTRFSYAALVPEAVGERHEIEMPDGQVFSLPPVFPLVLTEVFQTAADGRAPDWRTFGLVLVGPEQVDAFLPWLSSQFIQALLRDVYGESMGESSASADSSPSIGNGSRPTSLAVTG